MPIEIEDEVKEVYDAYIKLAKPFAQYWYGSPITEETLTGIKCQAESIQSQLNAQFAYYEHDYEVLLYYNKDLMSIEMGYRIKPQEPELECTLPIVEGFTRLLPKYTHVDIIDGVTI